jgi:hypothetical protein
LIDSFGLIALHRLLFILLCLVYQWPAAIVCPNNP